jgi:hypothetical protein
VSAGHTVYSPEFKATALELVRQIGRKPAARQLGVAVNTLHRWEKPDLYARQLLGSADAKWRRKELCVRGCGRLTSYDRPGGICTDCYIQEHRPDHGTRSRYMGGCRCDDCREAQRVHTAELRRRGDAPRHGVSGYKNYGCRCATCTAAHTAYCRERRRTVA